MNMIYSKYIFKPILIIFTKLNGFWRIILRISSKQILRVRSETFIRYEVSIDIT